MVLRYQNCEIEMTEKLLPDDIDIKGSYPNLNRRLRLGIVGGGRIAATQAMAARLTGLWEIVAGALSSDPVKAMERSKEWHLPSDRSYTSFEHMAECESSRSDGIDAVMVTTPNNVHYSASKAFLESGTNVICDKPLTNRIDEAKNLVELTASFGGSLGVGYVMSCFPMIRQAREIVANGGVGDLNQIHVEFMQDWMIPDDIDTRPHVKWRLDPEISGQTSCVGDIGTHAAHLASYVSSLELTALKAEFHICGTPKPLEDTVFMFTRYEGNIPGTLMATRLAPGKRGGLLLRIFGSRGGVEWNLENSEQLRFYRYGEPDQVITRGHGHGVSKATERLVRTGRGFPEGIIEAWANLYTEFAIAIAFQHDHRDLPKGWGIYPRVTEGAKGVRFIDASVRSNQDGGAWVEV